MRNLVLFHNTRSQVLQVIVILEDGSTATRTLPASQEIESYGVHPSMNPLIQRGHIRVSQPKVETPVVPAVTSEDDE